MSQDISPPWQVVPLEDGKADLVPTDREGFVCQGIPIELAEVLATTANRVHKTLLQKDLEITQLRTKLQLERRTGMIIGGELSAGLISKTAEAILDNPDPVSAEKLKQISPAIRGSMALLLKNLAADTRKIIQGAIAKDMEKGIH